MIDLPEHQCFFQKYRGCFYLAHLLRLEVLVFKLEEEEEVRLTADRKEGAGGACADLSSTAEDLANLEHHCEP
jgi:hypothetical protein